MFQFTLSWESDDEIKKLIAFMDVSIHALVRERRQLQSISTTGDVSIHALVRERRDVCLWFLNLLGFNSRSRERATIAPAFPIGLKVVSIHALVRERQCYYAPSGGYIAFQFTLSWESDSCSVFCKLWNTRFNSRSRERATRNIWAVFFGHSFQFTLSWESDSSRSVCPSDL